MGSLTTYTTANDGSTPLQWLQYTPSGTGKFPAVLVIHAGGFRSGLAGPANVTQDLANNGNFLSFGIQYRLAATVLPPHDMPNQTASHGYVPNQTDDCEMAVEAALAHPLCNGKIGAVGGSTGAAHALDLIAKGLIDCAVLLSGPYDYGDHTSLTDPLHTNFANDVYNYVRTEDETTLHSVSPIVLVSSSMKPVHVVASDQDKGMPAAQYPLLINALTNVGAPFTSRLRANSNLHAFEYWASPTDSVRQESIDFLTQYLS